MKINDKVKPKKINITQKEIARIFDIPNTDANSAYFEVREKLSPRRIHDIISTLKNDQLQPMLALDVSTKDQLSEAKSGFILCVDQEDKEFMCKRFTMARFSSGQIPIAIKRPIKVFFICRIPFNLIFTRKSIQDGRNREFNSIYLVQSLNETASSKVSNVLFTNIMREKYSKLIYYRNTINGREQVLKAPILYPKGVFEEIINCCILIVYYLINFAINYILFPVSLAFLNPGWSLIFAVLLARRSQSKFRKCRNWKEVSSNNKRLDKKKNLHFQNSKLKKLICLELEGLAIPKILIDTMSKLIRFLISKYLTLQLLIFLVILKIVHEDNLGPEILRLILSITDNLLKLCIKMIIGTYSKFKSYYKKVQINRSLIRKTSKSVKKWIRTNRFYRRKILKTNSRDRIIITSIIISQNIRFRHFLITNKGIHALNGNIKIISANFGKSYYKLDDLYPIFSYNPDIIMLQEISCYQHQLKQVNNHFRNIGYLGIGSARTQKTVAQEKTDKALKKGKPIYTIDQKNRTGRNNTSSFILIRKEIMESIQLVEKYSDPKGRVTNMTIRINKSQCLTFWSIYGPAEGVTASNPFFSELSKLVKNHDNQMENKKGLLNINFFGGDMNAKMNMYEDVKIQQANPQHFAGFISFIRDHGLMDAFSFNSKDKINFTWGNGTQETRIDWFLVPPNEKLHYFADTLNLKKGIIKDHKAIMLEIRFENFNEEWENGTNTFKRNLYDLDKEELINIFKSDSYSNENDLLNGMAMRLMMYKDILNVPITLALDFLNELRNWNQKCFEKEIIKREEKFEEEVIKKRKERKESGNSPRVPVNITKERSNLDRITEEFIKEEEEKAKKKEKGKDKDKIKKENDEKMKAKKEKENQRKMAYFKKKFNEKNDEKSSQGNRIAQFTEQNEKIEKVNSAIKMLRDQIPGNTEAETIKNRINELKARKNDLIRKKNENKFDRKIKKVIELHSGNVKELNDRLNRGLFEKTVVNDVKDDEGNNIEGVANILKYFVDGWGNVFKSQVENDFRLSKFDDRESDITKEEFTDMLTNLNSTTPGPDNLPGNVIKLNERFREQIFICFRVIYRNKIMPKEWKDSYTRLIHKTGPTGNYSNYRPICLLNAEYKAYSYIINKKLQKHFYDNNTISKHQFGFRPEFGTDQAIWTFLNVLENFSY